MSLQHRPGRGKLVSRPGDPGYAMVALLVSLGIMSVMMGVALPVWRQAAQREKEAELAWRGEQYARAVGLFQRKYGGAFPPNVKLLVEQKFLRKLYKDPMTKDGEFQIMFQAGQPRGTGGPNPPPTAGGTQATSGAQGGIIGVTSKSKERSIRLYKGRARYNEWQFVYVPVTTQGGAGGAGTTKKPPLPVKPPITSPPIDGGNPPTQPPDGNDP